MLGRMVAVVRTCGVLCCMCVVFFVVCVCVCIVGLLVCRRGLLVLRARREGIACGVAI